MPYGQQAPMRGTPHSPGVSPLRSGSPLHRRTPSASHRASSDLTHLKKKNRTPQESAPFDARSRRSTFSQERYGRGAHSAKDASVRAVSSRRFLQFRVVVEYVHLGTVRSFSSSCHDALYQYGATLKWRVGAERLSGAMSRGASVRPQSSGRKEKEAESLTLAFQQVITTPPLEMLPNPASNHLCVELWMQSHHPPIELGHVSVNLATHASNPHLRTVGNVSRVRACLPLSKRESPSLSDWLQDATMVMTLETRLVDVPSQGQLGSRSQVVHQDAGVSVDQKEPLGGSEDPLGREEYTSAFSPQTSLVLPENDESPRHRELTESSPRTFHDSAGQGAMMTCNEELRDEISVLEMALQDSKQKIAVLENLVKESTSRERTLRDRIHQFESSEDKLLRTARESIAILSEQHRCAVERTEALEKRNVSLSEQLEKETHHRQQLELLASNYHTRHREALEQNTILLEKLQQRQNQIDELRRVLKLHIQIQESPHVHGRGRPHASRGEPPRDRSRDGSTGVYPEGSY